MFICGFNLGIGWIIGLSVAAVVLVSFAILSCFVVGIYKPIDKEDAITCSKEFQDFQRSCE